MVRTLPVDPAALDEAARLLAAGQLVAFPTETVYGLGANALDDAAVARIFAAKGRPAINPLIAHFGDVDGAGAHAVFDARARRLAEAYWPGPLTLVLPRRPEGGLVDRATAGLATLAVRVPAHPAALALLARVDFPVVAPSANRSGALSPTCASHVIASLGDAVALVLDAGPCPVGLESTVLDLSGEEPVLLRPGAVTSEQLGETLGRPVARARTDQGPVRSPGLLLKHYAPRTAVRLEARHLEEGEALLAFGPPWVVDDVEVEGGGSVRGLPTSRWRNLSPEGDLAEAAANLFAMLEELDRPEHRTIAVMPIPSEGIGAAINDRLSRAAQGR